jgi:hypothetical protein
MDPHSHSHSRNQNAQHQSQPARANNNNGNSNSYQASAQSQEAPANKVMRDEFPYNHTINATFNTYNEASFNHDWDAAESIQNYGTGHNAWNPNVLHSTTNLLSGPEFALQSRNFDQTYPRTQPVDYSSFPASNPALSSTSFDPTFVPYGQVPLPDDANFDYPHQAFRTVTRPSDTISPQALQAYPTATFDHVQIPDTRPVRFHSDHEMVSVGKLRNANKLCSLRNIRISLSGLAKELLGMRPCRSNQLRTLAGARWYRQSQRDLPAGDS